jgi:hypothetical protein
MKTVEKYRIFKSRITGAPGAEGVFIHGEQKFKIKSFNDGEGGYLIRFMPCETGLWNYILQNEGWMEEGQFQCNDSGDGNHGPMRTDGFHFRYDDGTRFIPLGTTCYAWTHQPEELQQQTLKTLRSAPFNKIRMCVFPKHMPYNHNEPELFPFHKKSDGGWDVYNPDLHFWHNFESRIAQLMDIGVEADLILFHPYDRWGFAALSTEECLAYLEYCVTRLSVYRNVWWSLANEYDLMFTRTEDDWQAFGEAVTRFDPYGHLISVHHCLLPFPKNGWMTHCSMQTRYIGNAYFWRQEYGLPVIIDECGYEGNVEFGWGNLSAFELIHRFWSTVTRGGYCTHGETFFREDEVLWWAKGGRLYGESVSRIQFLKETLYSLPQTIDPIYQEMISDPNEKGESHTDNENGNAFAIKMFTKLISKIPEPDRNLYILDRAPGIVHGPDYRLLYLGRECSVFYDLQLPEDAQCRVEILDVWKMTRVIFAESASGWTRVRLPGKEGIALLITHLAGSCL